MSPHNKEQKRYGPNIAEDIKKRWQEYTEEFTTKILMTQITTNGVTTHWEPDILECEGSGPEEASLQTNLVEVMEFQLSYFNT